MKNDAPILLFDGVCNLCNGFVQFIIRHDEAALFKFASLQSEAGQALLSQYNLSKNLDTVVLIYNNEAYTHSDAPLKIAALKGGWWTIFSFFKIVPKPLRDGIYKWVARNRYRWFGKQESCMMPTPALKQRFLN